MTLLWPTLTLLLLIGVAAGVISLVLGHCAAWRLFGRRGQLPLPDPTPKVSILKPVEGADPDSAEALASFCHQDYPGTVEILIGTLSKDDPIVPIVRQLQRTSPKANLRLVVATLQGANRKTSIMETLWRESSGDFLFFSDADVRVEKDYLRRLVPYLVAPDVGCLTCLPRGIRAHTLGARLIALHYTFTYLPQWMLAQRTTGIDWAIGHTMAVPRSVLHRLDGFRGFLDHLADDYELGHRTSRLGLRVIVPPLLLDCAMPQESFRAAFRRLLRWKRTMRRARGFAFLGASLTYPLCWTLPLVLLHPAALWAWMTLLGLVALRFLLAAWLQHRVHLPDWPRSWWLLPISDLLEGLSFVGAYTGNQVSWAGRRYRLQRDGTLRPPK